MIESAERGCRVLAHQQLAEGPRTELVEDSARHDLLDGVLLLLLGSGLEELAGGGSRKLGGLAHRWFDVRGSWIVV